MPRADMEHPGQPRVSRSVSGSGLFTSHKQLTQLLKMVGEDRVEEVTITYADRFNRFGHAYLECLCDSFGITLTMREPKEDKTPGQELTADLFAVIESFSGRMSGMGFHKQKGLVTCALAEIFSL